jgi:actin-binding protein anillin
VWLRRWFTLTNEQNLKYWSSPEDEEANMVSASKDFSVSVVNSLSV